LGSSLELLEQVKALGVTQESCAVHLDY